MTAAEIIAEIDRIEPNATAAPWQRTYDFAITDHGGAFVAECEGGKESDQTSETGEANAALIVALRNRLALFRAALAYAESVEALENTDRAGFDAAADRWEAARNRYRAEAARA